MKTLRRMFRCSYCQYQSRHFFSWCFHNKHKHSNEPGFILTCLYEACGKTFKNVKGLQRHIKTFHAEFYSTLLHPRVHNVETSSVHSNNDTISENLNSSVDDISIAEAKDEDVNYTKYLAQTLIATKEHSKVADKPLFNIFEDLISVSSKLHANTVRKIKKVLTDNNIDVDISILKDLLNETSPLESGWDEINSTKKLDKYAYANLCPVKPIEIVLGLSDGVKECYQYIPIIETLTFLLKFKDIQSYVFNNHQSEDGILRDVCDGLFFRRNALFSSDATALSITLYLDEVNFVNPLGNKVKKHKIYAFYMQLGNIAPSRKSTLESIFLVALCKSKYVKKYGLSTVLEQFINDIKILETEGLSLYINGRLVKLKGTVVICVSDNLAAHGIGGFTESFSSLKVCRFCMISKSQLANVFVGTERTKTSYDQQCLLVKQSPDLRKAYGIKEKSCLNELQYFHVMNGLPPDITHDIFEGVGKYVLKSVIEYCIRVNYFSLDSLNDSISSFDYQGPDKITKPHIVPPSHEIKQTASETWCLLRLFPLIIGINVPLGDSKWNILIQLLDIIEYICMQDIEYGQVLFVDDLIKDFSELYAKEFPEETVKPKFHFLHHYSDLTLKYGPLVHCWTIRFEAKHSWFKQTFSSSKCYKNIEKTLAKKHQLMLSSFASKENYFKSVTHEVTGGKVLSIDEFQPEIQDVIRLELGNVTEIFKASKIRVHGFSISSGCAIPINEEGDLVTFKEVIYCFLKNNEAYCLCEELVTKNYIRHYHAFKVCKGGSFFMFKLSELVSTSNFSTLGMYHIRHDKDHKYIVLKTRNISRRY